MMKFILIFLVMSLKVNVFPLCLPLFQEDPYKPFTDVMPEPVGGLETIYKTISYPELAKKSGVQGKVYLLVYINESGGVDDVKVVKGIGAGCDEAAIDAIKKASFTPGKMNGTPVKTKLSLPVIFKMK
jgi:protein TonB